MKITALDLLVGPQATSKLRLPVGGVNVFVGPNGSGKSFLLRELSQAIRMADTAGPRRIVAGIQADYPGIEQIHRAMEPFKAIDSGRSIEYASQDAGAISLPKDEHQLLTTISQYWNNGQLRRFFFRSISQQERAQIGNVVGLEKANRRPRGAMSELFFAKTGLPELRRHCLQAFHKHVVVDAATTPGQVQLRLSSRAPKNEAEEFAYYESSTIDFHQAALPLADCSDGVKSFVAQLFAVLVQPQRVFIIDEPEAFLHPPLARRLGNVLAAISKSTGKQFFVATHSADFLLGAVESQAEVQVARLSYNEEAGATVRVLPTDELLAAARDPLLRSAAVLSGLFADGVIVSESDSDRVFYQEIHYRLAEAGRESDVGLHFIHAHTKQNEHRPAALLRRFGVPTAMIVDIDFIADGGQTFSAFLEAAGVPAELRSGLGQTRGTLKTTDGDDTMKRLKAGGIAALSTSSKREAVESFVADLARRGLFLVPVGELEGWLKALAVPGQKNEWVTAMLDRLGSDPKSANYVKPSEGDVWAFLEGVVRWLRDPNRLGMSADV